MAQDMYMNPESIRPKYGWQPQGFLAGMWSQQDRQRYQDMASLQDMMAQMAAAKEQEDLMMGAPVRAAKRREELNKADLATLLAQSKMKIPGYGEAIARGAMGEAGQQEAAGNLAMGTTPQKITAMNLENIVKARENDILRQRYAESSDPFGDLVRSPSHIRDVTKQREKIEGDYKQHIDQAKIAAAAQRYAADAQRDRVKENEAQRRSAVLKQVSGARSMADLGEDGPGLVGEAMRFIANDVINEPEVKGLSGNMAMGNFAPEMMPRMKESLREALERAWDTRTAGMPLLRQVNPYKRKGQPVNPQMDKGVVLDSNGLPIPGAVRLP